MVTTVTSITAFKTLSLREPLKAYGKAWVYSCKLPVEPLPSTPLEKESKKNCPLVQNDPLSQANRGFQVDHLYDPPPSDRSFGRATSDSPITSLIDRELAELVEGDRHADS
jgi:hypothetical protein